MSNHYQINKPFSAKRTLALACLVCLAGVGAWAQSTQLYIDTAATTQVATSKVYDGTTAANVTFVGTTVGIDPSHSNVALQASAYYTDPNVGGIKMVVVTYSLIGADSAYYLPPFNDTLWAAITPRPLSITGTIIDSAKAYNRSMLVNVQRVGSLVGVVPGDNIFPSALARYTDPNVGVSKPVTITYSLYSSNTQLCNNYVPPATDTLYADITPRVLYAPTVSLAASKIYDGNTNYPVNDPGILTGILNGDTVYHTVTATLNSPSAGWHMAFLTFTLHGTQSFNYTITDTSLFSSQMGLVLQRPLSAQGATVRTVKTYDGTTNAVVLSPAMAANFVDGDNIQLATTASYDSPEIGNGKTITIHCEIVENEYSSNYIAPDDQVYTTNGRIIAPTMLDSTYGINGILAARDNFCPGDSVQLTCHLAQGEPTYYRISYPEESANYGPLHCGDTIYPSIDPINTLNMAFFLPEDFPSGLHTATITIGNEALDEITFTFDFTVNLPNSYLVQVFNDVVSIDNTTEQFNTFQWYKNGNPIEGATKPYYQDPDGYLNGSYSLKVNAGTDNEHMICPIVFTNTPQKSIAIAPNPVVSTATVKITGSDNGQHMLTLYNSHGTPVIRTTFNGSEYQLNMSNLPQGIYMITVDDMTSKTLKL